MSCFLDCSAPTKVTVCKSEDSHVTDFSILTPFSMRITCTNFFGPITPVPREKTQDSESPYEGLGLCSRWLQEACGNEKGSNLPNGVHGAVIVTM